MRAISDGSVALAALMEHAPHLVIIDWNMPGFAALDLIAGARRMRVPHEVRLILLSALSNEPDVVAGFDLGADDYIAKPFSVREVVARVCAVLRPQSRHNRGEVVSCGELMIESSTNRVTARGRVLNLRGVEYRILKFIMSHPRELFTRAQILSHVWGSKSKVDERTIDVNVRRLRKILEAPGYEAHIQTVRGFGYRFATARELTAPMEKGVE